MANKKINQLVSKTAILSTDLFGIGDATTGQLFKKTIAELQAAIGGAVISVNGLVGTVVLDTDDIQELATPTNKYFTDARARGAISLTVTGNSGASTYSSGTGVLNVPTYTLAGLGGITASFLSGASGISYNSTTGVISYLGTVYTDASIRALLSGGTGITYNSSTGAISYSGTVYTDSSVRALISMTTTGDSGASTYNNTTGVINVPNYTLAGLGGISYTSLSGGTGITYNNTTGAISYSGTVYTDASVRALISASGAVSYNNTTGVISLTSGNLTEATSSVLTITGGTGAVLGSGTSIQVKQASSTISGFLSSTDWSTFNSKQGTITLTTTGTSGAATLTSGTLNIPQYQSALTNPVTGTGTTNYVSKWTSTSAIGNSSIFDDGSKVGIGTSSPVSRVTISNSSTTITTLNLDQGAVGNCLAVASSGSSGTMYIANFRSAGVDRFRILDNGNVGIGTTSPDIFSRAYTTILGISSSTGDTGIMINGGTSSGGYIDLGTSGTRNMGIISTTTESQIISLSTIPLVLKTNGIDRIKITSGGSILVGGGLIYGRSTISASASKTNTTVNDAACAMHLTTSESDTPFGIKFFLVGNSTGSARYVGIQSGEHGVANDGQIVFQSGGGNILMGTTSNNGEKLYVSGNIRATGTITANSDVSLKKNLLKIENALEKVEQINGYTYELKEDDSKRHGGVIAQEIDKVFPEIVNTGNDGLMGVEYGNISALLIEAIKEQNTKIKNLETLLASK